MQDLDRFPTEGREGLVQIVRLHSGRATCAPDADDASRALNKAGALESRDGSYRLVSNSAETPRQLRWDEQGRWVWAFDAEIEYEER